MINCNFYKSVCSLFIVLSLSLSVNAQLDTHCGTTDLMNLLMKKDTSLARRMALMQQAAKKYVALHPTQDQRSIVTIPVVVHVINNGEPIGTGANISDAQVLSELTVLNQDYRRLNADTFKTPDVFKPLAADMGIQFVMAVRDPNGRPTNGIDRVNGHAASWVPFGPIETTIKPQTIWNDKIYMNIWTVQFSASTNVLGYTIIPVPEPDSTTDGVIVGYPYFGNTGNVDTPDYSTGRTATHEIGHWFGLYHPWGVSADAGADNCGDSGALISDVPPAESANFGCPSFPHVSCVGTPYDNSPNGDMFMNYMDYTNDYCMNLFTNGQKAYAYYVLDSIRTTILSSMAGTRYTYDAAMLSVRLPGTEVCSDSFNPLIQISNEGTETLTTCYINYNIDNNINGQFNWTGNLLSAQSEFVTLPALKVSDGAHTINFYLSYPNNKADQFSLNDGITVNFTTGSNSTPGQPMPLTEGFDDGTIPALWTATVSHSQDTIEWQATTAAGAGGSGGSIWADNFAGSKNGNSRGTRADFTLQPLAVDSGHYPFVTFDVAYAQRDTTSNDSLIVSYSLDCGSNWYPVYANGGSTLKTAAPQTTSYIPATGDWRQDGTDIFEVTNQDNVLFRFEAYSDWGNNIYVDNINIGEYLTGINEVPKSSINVVISPNPSTGKFTASFNRSLPANSSLQVFDLLGRSVYFDQNISGTNEVIDLTGNTAGVYIAKVVSGNNSIVKKLVIQ